MAVLERAAYEKFAQALARGVEAWDAYAIAGYKPGKHCRRLAERPEVIKRVEEIAAERAWGGSRDLVGLIEALKRAFDVAITLKSAAGMAAARAIVAEAARLKQLLPPDPVLPDPRIVDLTDEEWTARYGPPAP